MKNSKFEIRNPKDLARIARSGRMMSPRHRHPRQPRFTPFGFLMSNFEF